MGVVDPHPGQGLWQSFSYCLGSRVHPQHAGPAPGSMQVGRPAQQHPCKCMFSSPALQMSLLSLTLIWPASAQDPSALFQVALGTLCSTFMAHGLPPGLWVASSGGLWCVDPCIMKPQRRRLAATTLSYLCHTAGQGWWLLWRQEAPSTHSPQLPGKFQREDQFNTSAVCPAKEATCAFSPGNSMRQDSLQDMPAPVGGWKVS